MASYYQTNLSFKHNTNLFHKISAFTFIFTVQNPGSDLLYFWFTQLLAHSFNLEICNTHRSGSLQNQDENRRPDLIKQNKKQTWSENRTFDQNFKLA